MWSLILISLMENYKLRLFQYSLCLQVTLPDGAIKEGKSWQTTPYSVAASISQVKKIYFLRYLIWDMHINFNFDIS